MSELDKLTAKWQAEHSKRFTKHLGQYYAQVDKLQKECEHKKTHWIQELDKDGSFKGELVKRCFVCGANPEKLDCPEVQMELFLDHFDADVERYKMGCVDKDETVKQ